MTGQLPLDLPHRPSYAEEDFLAAPSNERALALLRLWPDWPHKVLLLVGPEGAGKSHLGAIWARRAGARIVSARDLAVETLPQLANPPALLVEDADDAPLRETEMFHLINLAMERGVFLLITARKGPDAWGVQTRDLLSRLRRAPSIAIEQPDEEFLRIILVKLFHDRQIKVEASLIDFLALRLERSFEAAQRAVAALDREALARRRAVTRALAAEWLAAGETAPHDEEH
jgi:chromosomal replication initiation ATPase DnaA